MSNTFVKFTNFYAGFPQTKKKKIYNNRYCWVLVLLWQTEMKNWFDDKSTKTIQKQKDKSAPINYAFEIKNFVSFDPFVVNLSVHI